MKTQRIKNLTVKTSKDTGYFYLEAKKVKKAIDALIDAQADTTAIDDAQSSWINDTNKRVDAFERRVGETIERISKLEKRKHDKWI